MKLTRALILMVIAVIGGIGIWNYAFLAHPVRAHLAEDKRNDGKGTFWFYHRFGIDPSTLVIDVRAVSGETAGADILRALFQSADKLKDREFDTIVLAHRGDAKLTLSGKYFQLMGNEFATQNPMYAIRTLPQNVRRMDGTPAYSTWTGGMLGVLGKQMKDVNSFMADWYLSDISKDP